MSELQPLVGSGDSILFPTLPTEIRLQIWSHALQPHLTPRIHTISSKAGNPSRFFSNQSIPNLLHICHESRSVFLTKTEALFVYGTYINFDLDSIYIPEFPLATTTDDQGLTLSQRPLQGEGIEALKDLQTNRLVAERLQKLATSVWCRWRVNGEEAEIDMVHMDSPTNIIDRIRKLGVPFEFISMTFVVWNFRRSWIYPKLKLKLIDGRLFRFTKVESRVAA